MDADPPYEVPRSRFNEATGNLHTRGATRLNLHAVKPHRVVTNPDIRNRIDVEYACIGLGLAQFCKSDRHCNRSLPPESIRLVAFDETVSLRGSSAIPFGVLADPPRV